jgi:hypothetical protein
MLDVFLSSSMGPSYRVPLSELTPRIEGAASGQASDDASTPVKQQSKVPLPFCLIRTRARSGTRTLYFCEVSVNGGGIGALQYL